MNQAPSAFLSTPGAGLDFNTRLKNLLFGVPMIAVCLLALGFGVWATFAPLAGGAVAPGQVIIDGARQSIQHLEGGILSQMNVREGSLVEQGDVLAEIESTAVGARRDAVALKLFALRVKEARLLSEQRGLDAFAIPGSLSTEVTSQKSGDIVGEDQNILRQNREILDARLRLLSEKEGQTRAQILGLESQQLSVNEQISSLKEDIEGQKILLEKGLARLPTLRQLERQHSELQGSLRLSATEVQRLNGVLRELDASRREVLADRELRVATELIETKAGIKQATEELKLVEDAFTRARIVAPIAGRVMNVVQQSPGAVISPGEEIMEIVPESPKLIVEAHVSPTDIEDLQVGDQAILVFPNFSQRKLPRMEGELVSLSGDVIFDEVSGRPFYIARIAVPAGDIRYQETLDKLRPGMPADVTIVTKSRTLAEYLLLPLTESFRKSVVSG